MPLDYSAVLRSVDGRRSCVRRTPKQVIQQHGSSDPRFEPIASDNRGQLIGPAGQPQFWRSRFGARPPSPARRRVMDRLPRCQPRHQDTRDPEGDAPGTGRYSSIGILGVLRWLFELCDLAAIPLSARILQFRPGSIQSLQTRKQAIRGCRARARRRGRHDMGARLPVDARTQHAA